MAAGRLAAGPPTRRITPDLTSIPFSARNLPTPDVGRHGLVGQSAERLNEGNHLLVLLAEPPDRNGAFGRLLLAGHQQRRDLGERMLAHLVVDLLVAQIGS